MRSMLDQIFKYRLNQRIAFKDSLTKKILYGDIQNRWLDHKKRMYTVRTDVLLTVCEWDIIGFVREKKI
jgi:hypothetical protein